MSEHQMTLSAEELAKKLLAITGARDKNVYTYFGSKMRRVVGVYVEEIDPQAIVIETEEL